MSTRTRPRPSTHRRAEAEPRGATITRRLKTIPRLLIAFAIATPLLPLLLLLALMVDLSRLRRPARWMTLRIVAIFYAYLVAETIGLIALTGIWLFTAGWTEAGRRRMLGPTFTVQRAWTAFLWGVFAAAMRLEVRVEGRDALASTPVIVLVRHASLIDTLVPHVFAANPSKLRFRYVLKKELLSDPCLDVAGRRLPNRFIDRAPGDGAEAERVGSLAVGIGEGEGAVIYPEGTRYTSARRERALARIAASDPAMHARAERLRAVMPPRVRGTFALLDHAPGTDVVMIEHRGLEPFIYLGDLWRGALLRARVDVRMRRIPRESIPAERDDRTRWLLDRWAEMDAWVMRHEP